MDRRRRAVVGGAVVGAVALASVVTSPSMALSRLAWLAADPVRYGLACLALSAVRPLVAWPVTLIAVAVGFGFGPAGVPLTLALMVLSSVPPYVFARRLGVAGRVAAAGERLIDATGGTRAVAASRLLPTPSDAVSVAAGVSGVRLRPFLVGSTVGETPWAVAGTLAGASLESLVRGSPTFDPLVVVGAAMAAVLLLAGPAYRVYRERRTSSD